jgi:hypothetical protein
METVRHTIQILSNLIPTCEFLAPATRPNSNSHHLNCDTMIVAHLSESKTSTRQPYEHRGEPLLTPLYKTLP